MIIYPGDVELGIVFDYISEHCKDYDGSVIDYRIESDGIERLKSVLTFAKDDDLYPSIYDKTAYIFAAVITGHYFQNGNKRLAVYVTFLLFVMNGYMFAGTLSEKQKSTIQPLITRVMRNIDNDGRIKIVQHGFIYALAIYIAKGKRKFDLFKKDAHKLFSVIIKSV